MVLVALPIRAAILHVQADAAGAETNGLSWATAFNSITQATAVASSGDELWVAAGTYKAWSCEAAAHEARTGSGHDKNRICTNTLQSTHTSTQPYPVGSAAVKELIDGDGNIEGYSVYLRSEAGDGGEKRFWYEIIGGDVIAIGYGHSTCTGCHGGAPRDFVFTQIR